MNAPARRESRGLMPDLPDWMESPMSVLRPFTPHSIRVESYVDDGHYVVRAELPGVHPERDVQVTVADGALTIRAERHEEHEGKYRSEFRYGVFSRQVPLPVGADENDIEASYDRGVLEVSVGLKKKAEKAARQIPISRGR